MDVTSPALVRPRPARTALLISGLSIAVVVTALVSVGSGQLSISPLEVLSVLLKPVGIDLGVVTEHPNAEAALWSIRLPRVVMSLVIGAALAFGAGLLTTLVVYVFSQSRGKTEVVTLILAGIAVNAFCGTGLASTCSPSVRSRPATSG